jgi:uncharacterized membrane-anchored protein
MTDRVSKVPEVTIAFWLVKIARTTLGDWRRHGYDDAELGLSRRNSPFLRHAHRAGRCTNPGKAIPALPFIGGRLSPPRPSPTMADFANRSLGIGYTGGSALLLVCLLIVLGLWYRSEGSISVNTVSTPKVEAFYWAAITFSQTLGTALGDWMADTRGLGYERGAFVFAAGLAVIAGLYAGTKISRVWLFWMAFILIRPFGAAVGDFLDKPVAQGGLALSRLLASIVIAIFIVVWAASALGSAAARVRAHRGCRQARTAVGAGERRPIGADRLLDHRDCARGRRPQKLPLEWSGEAK